MKLKRSEDESVCRESSLSSNYVTLSYLWKQLLINNNIVQLLLFDI